MLGQICYVPIVTKSDVTYTTTTKANGYKYFEVNFQADLGVTIKIKVEKGDVVAFGSHTLPIPTEYLYQVKAEREGDKNLRIWDIDERRRLTTGNSTAYFSVKGIEDIDSKIEMTVVDGLYCDDGSEVDPGEKCNEDAEEEEIFSFEG